MCKKCVTTNCESVKMNKMFVTFLVPIVLWIGECSGTATFQVDMTNLLGLQKRNSALSSIVDYRQTTLDTVKNIHFKYFDRQGFEAGRKTLMNDDSGICQPGDYAIIMHGWQENCDTEWVSLLASNLSAYRGGCIMCMDYFRYSKLPYMQLFSHFDAIAEVLAGKLRQLERLGFSPDRGFLFGFSYGGRLALEAAQRFGPKKISKIDICDIAGPMFDFRKAFVDHRRAAKNVQCIFTSRDKGSRHTTACHQNWKMGNCGWSQVAAQDPPLGSHGLCPYFYLSAFSNDFPAVKKPAECGSRRMANHWPSGFKMGYMEHRKSQVSGELFALTTRYYPYNSNSSNVYTGAGVQSQDYSNQKVISSWDIDMDYNAQPNYIPRSRRGNDFLQEYWMNPPLKY